MNQELISKLIEIAIENWYSNFKKFNICENNEIYAREIDEYINLYELITSKPFIDAIALYITWVSMCEIISVEESEEYYLDTIYKLKKAIIESIYHWNLEQLFQIIVTRKI